MGQDMIAIVGIGCRLPGGANSPLDLWKNLMEQKDCMREVPPERWDLRRFYSPVRTKPGKMITREGGFLTCDLKEFDPLFFGLSPREAEHMDPQQRLALEVTWEALEDAGIDLEAQDAHSIGVYIAGFNLEHYAIYTSRLNRYHINQHFPSGTMMTMLSNKISYALNLKGPSFSVDTACSASMTSVYAACQDLQMSNCDIAIAGGSAVMLSPDTMICLTKGGFISSYGRSRAFACNPEGYGRSEGAGVVILKRVEKALEDKDQIYAVIRNIALGHDGKKAGIASPSKEEQANLMRRVYQKAGINPADVAYVEAHGTGTAAGDKAETDALSEVFLPCRSKENPLVVGAIKTSIGHTEAAAGIAGIIKTALVLRNRTVPPNLYTDSPNPAIPQSGKGLHFPSQPLALDDEEPLFAGVSSFGYGGANGHALLQTAPENKPKPTTRPVELDGEFLLAPVSARSTDALRALGAKYADHLKTTQVSVHDFCHTLIHRRTFHSSRAAVVFRSRDELIHRLSDLSQGKPHSDILEAEASETSPRLLYVFTGMGPQWYAMGRELFRAEPEYRRVIEECDAYLQELCSWSLVEELNRDAESSRINETEIAQPAIVALQIGLTQLWKSWGVLPGAVLGHSLGEFSAAWAAGILSLRDTMRIIFHRGKRLATLRGKGTMLAVALPEEDINSYLHETNNHVSIAAINDGSSCTLSGDEKELNRIAGKLEQKEIFHRFLRVEIPFHSKQTEEIIPSFLSDVGDFSSNTPQLPFFSTVRSCKIEDEKLDSRYWADNIRMPVQFSKTLALALHDGYSTIVEVGPHPVLRNSILSVSASIGKKVQEVGSLIRKEPEVRRMYQATAALFSFGYDLDWGKLFPHKGQFAKIPTYPWQRQRYWFDSEASLQDRIGRPGAHPFLQVRADVDEVVYESEPNPEYFPWLEDHCILGETVFPGTGYIQAGLELGKEMFGTNKILIQDIRIDRLLAVDEENTRCLATSYNAETKNFRIASKDTVSADGWVTHASGRIAGVFNNATPERISVESIMHRCLRQIDPNEIYSRVEKQGLTYGPSFKNVQELHVGENEILAKLRIEHPAITPEHFETLVLDGAFLSLGCAIGLTQLQGDAPFVPVRVGEVRFWAPLTSEVAVHARPSWMGKNAAVGNIRIMTPDGILLAEVTDLVLERLTISPKGLPGDLSFYHVHETVPCSESDKTGKKMGHEALVFLGAQGFIDNNKLFPEAQHRISTDKEDLWLPAVSKALEDLPDNSHAAASIVYAVALSDENQEDGVSDQLAKTFFSLRNVVSAVADSSRTARVVVVVQSSCTQANTCSHPGADAIFGFADTLSHEYQEIEIVGICAGKDLESIHLPDLGKETRGYMRRLLPGVEGITPDITLRQKSLDESNKQVSTSSAWITAGIGSLGDLSTLSFSTSEPSAPGNDEILLEVQAVPLNFKDVVKVFGKMPEHETRNTSAKGKIGHECAGKVLEVGSNVKNVKPGDKVVCGAAAGAFASRIIVPATQAVRCVGDRQLTDMCIGVPFVTAHYSLITRGNLAAGEKVLIHHGTGSVGLAAIQVARRAGAEVFVTAGNDIKREYLRSLGIEHVFDSRSIDFAYEIREATNGYGVDLVLGAATDDKLIQGFQLLADFGRYLEIGKAGIMANQGLPMRTFDKNVSFIGIDLDRLILHRPEQYADVLREVMAQFDSGVYSPLPVTVFPASEIADAFRLLTEAKHIGRVIVDMRNQTVEVAKTVESDLIKREATYVVTGGLGGFGLRTAARLAEMGAGNLLLIGRSGPKSDEAKSAIEEIKKKGTNVVAVSLDVSCREATIDTFKDLRGTIPPIRGIFHCAAVLRDMPARKMGLDDLTAVLRPKVDGAVNLHYATLVDDLDFFVCYSSVSAIFGTPGQANYAAANAFLDGFARWRRAKGLPCTSINWGAIGETGMVARDNSVRDKLIASGVWPMTLREVFDALEKVLLADETNICVAKIDWDLWAAANPSMAKSPMFAEVVSKKGTMSGSRIGELAAELVDHEKDGGNALEFASEKLRAQIAEVVRMSPERIEASQSLTKLGIDSLMGMELATKLNKELGVELSSFEIIKGITLQQLAEKSLEQIKAAMNTGE